MPLQGGGPPNSASVLSGHLVVMSDRSTRSSDRRGGNPDAAASPAAKQPSRRRPAQRREPPPPRPRAAGWGGAEKRKLATLFAEQGPAWQQIAIDLGTGRSAKAVRQRAIDDGLTLAGPARRPAADPMAAKRAKPLGKDAPRAAAAAAKAAALSPAVSPPDPRRQAAAKAAEAIAQSSDSDDPLHACPCRPANAEPLLHESAKRLAIAVQYVEVHKMAPQDEWFGADGTLVKIRRELAWIPEGSRDVILRVLDEVLFCWQSGVTYTGLRAVVPRAQAILALDGVEAQIIADDTESGLSLEQATYSVNLWRAGSCSGARRNLSRRQLLPCAGAGGVADRGPQAGVGRPGLLLGAGSAQLGDPDEPAVQADHRGGARGGVG